MIETLARTPRPSAMSPTLWGLPRATFAVSSGVLVVLAFPLYGDRYHLDHLVWVALVPLFLAARGTGWLRGCLLGWMCGVTLEGAGFIWILHTIRTFTGFGQVVSSLGFLAWLVYSALPWALLGAAIGRCRRPRHVVLVLPLWVGIEHFFPRLWPWHLGGALYGQTWLLQCVDLLGASGLTALVFLVSCALYRVLEYGRGRDRFPWKTLATALVLVTGALTYGALRLEDVRRFEASQSQRLRVGFVQGCVSPDQRLKSEPQWMLERYLNDTDLLIKEAGPLNLVLWPESVDQYAFVLTPEGAHRSWGLHPPEIRHRLENLPVPLVAGGSAVTAERERFATSVYFEPGEKPRFYKKNYRVPFGEVNPFLALLPESLRKEMSHVGSISAGHTNPPFALGGFQFRNLLCYEAVIPAYVRRSSPGSDFLVNLTEDYWYGRTAHIPQHVSVLVLRAVESRVPVLRSTNVGPSGVVDVTGTFHRGPEVFARDRFVREFAPGRTGSSYAEWGHWFPLLALIAGCALALRRSWAGASPG